MTLFLYATFQLTLLLWIFTSSTHSTTSTQPLITLESQSKPQHAENYVLEIHPCLAHCVKSNPSKFNSFIKCTLLISWIYGCDWRFEFIYTTWILIIIVPYNHVFILSFDVRFKYPKWSLKRMNVEMCGFKNRWRHEEIACVSWALSPLNPVRGCKVSRCSLKQSSFRVYNVWCA